MLREDWPQELDVLLGDSRVDLVGAIVTAAGGRLDGAKPRQVAHQPGRSTVVQYAAAVVWPDGRRTDETVVAAMGRRLPEGAAVLEAEGLSVAAWMWPIDPGLPGLAAAIDRARVARLLTDVGGAGPGGVRPQDIRLRVRAYRPGRRAVIEVSTDRARLFLKVVRPKVVERVHANHRLLADHAPVPASLGWSDDGILVLTALAGRTLRDALQSGRFPAPPPAAIDGVLDGLPQELASRELAAVPTTRAAHYAGVVAATMPSEATRLDHIVAEVDAVAASGHDLVPVHGDLYESQVLVDGGRVVGLLDIDTAGAGHRIDDVANLCAHLSVLAPMSARGAAINAYGSNVLAGAERRFERGDLRARIAAAVVGLATGPFRVLERDWPSATRRRLALAESWLGMRSPELS